MKYLMILIFAMCFATYTSTAQEETKKVVIIKKVKDENGKVVTENVRAEGKEADKLIEELKKDGTLEGIDIDSEISKAKTSTSSKTKKVKTTSEDIKIEKSVVNGKESTTYTITSNDGGNKEVMVWAGEGEMPAEMKEKIEKHKMEQLELDDSDQMIFIGDGDETKIVREIEVEMERSLNKVSLGVIVYDEDGVIIEKIMEDSSASKTDLQEGDTILKIDNTYIFNLKMLMNALNRYSKGDKCTVRYIRNGEEKSVVVEF